MLVCVVASLYVIVVIVFMTCTREPKASFSIFLALDRLSEILPDSLSLISLSIVLC